MNQTKKYLQAMGINWSRLKRKYPEAKEVESFEDIENMEIGDRVWYETDHKTVDYVLKKDENVYEMETQAQDSDETEKLEEEDSDLELIREVYNLYALKPQEVDYSDDVDSDPYEGVDYDMDIYDTKPRYK